MYNDIINTLNKSQEQFTDNSKLYYEIFDCIAKYSDFCKILLGKFGDPDFIKRLFYRANKQFVDKWSKNINNPVILEYLFSFIANGSVGIIQQWIERGLKEPVSDIASIHENLVNYGLNAFGKPV